MIAPEHFENVLTIEPTGSMKWKHPHGRAAITSEAGYCNNLGYRIITVNYRLYCGHCIAWYLYTGDWPEKGMVIDHINGVRDDNRKENLRVVTRRVNQQNMHMHRNGKLPGVIKRAGRFQARAKFSDKLYYFGTYDTPEEAHIAYMEAVKKEKPVK